MQKILADRNIAGAAVKNVLILLASLIVTVSPLKTVHAEESQVSFEPATAEQASTVDESAESSADREAYAKSLFEGRCQMCHQLPEPGMLRPKQWKLILTTMQQRMQQAGVPPLTEDETGRLLAYLGERAR